MFWCCDNGGQIKFYKCGVGGVGLAIMEREVVAMKMGRGNKIKQLNKNNSNKNNNKKNNSTKRRGVAIFTDF